MIFNHVLTTDESKEVFPYLQSLLTTDRFQAHGIVQTHNEIEQWHIEVNRPTDQWFAVNEHGHTHEYRDGVTFHRGEPVDHPTTVSSELVGPMIAAFPERLRWWGESDHDFRPILMEHIGQRSNLVTFEHGSDPSMRCTMVIDTELGLVTRVMQFNAPYIVLLDVERDKAVERITPQSFPKPEVIYPDY